MFNYEIANSLPLDLADENVTPLNSAYLAPIA
jgi:hypothetical protein